MSCKSIKYCGDQKPDTDLSKCIPSIAYVQPFTITTWILTYPATDIKTTEGITYLRYEVVDTLGNVQKKTLEVKIDKTLPAISGATVISPESSTCYYPDSPTMKEITPFKGYASDNSFGSGLNTDSTQFYIKRKIDNQFKYWTGTTWDAKVWLPTKHSGTDGDTSVPWAGNIAKREQWETGEYYVRALVTDKAGNKVINQVDNAEGGNEIVFSIILSGQSCPYS